MLDCDASKCFNKFWTCTRLMSLLDRSPGKNLGIYQSNFFGINFQTSKLFKPTPRASISYRARISQSNSLPALHLLPCVAFSDSDQLSVTIATVQHDYRQ
ncbi:hypothetical protein D5086_004091 [Populus alba]|uniref:Uncharacterized protein n=1 Tax=Populus alba TaxID=43335 RepID=A0ACC4CPS8_POPAL